MTVIHTEKAPAAIGPYSQGIDLGNMVFFSGQIPVNPATGEIPAGIEAQTKQVMENITAVLAAANLTLANVVKTTIFLDSLSDFAAMNAVYESYLAKPYPARSCVEVAAIPKACLVEIECIAVR